MSKEIYIVAYLRIKNIAEFLSWQFQDIEPRLRCPSKFDWPQGCEFLLLEKDENNMANSCQFLPKWQKSGRGKV